MTNYYFQF